MAFNQADQTSAPGSFKGKEGKTGPNREILFQEIQQTPDSADAQTFCPELHKGRSSAPALAKGRSRSGLSLKALYKYEANSLQYFRTCLLTSGFLQHIHTGTEGKGRPLEGGGP